MLLVASKAIKKKKRIYHRYDCIYARRIKPENRIEVRKEKMGKRRYHVCKYCAGLQGDVNVHKKAFATLSKKRNMEFCYHKASDTLYIRTEIGFWKVFLKKELGEYLLYHRNTYSAGMEFNEAIHGEFHRQSDVKATESIDKLVEYITAHDRAKLVIMDDYRKLPKSTRTQKKYYRAAERKNRRKAMRRLDSIFEMLEQTQTGIKQYSIC